MAIAYEKISWVASVLVLLLGFASCSSQGGGKFTHRSLNFWKALKAPLPPTGPNTGNPPPDSSRKFNFGTLTNPKGVPINFGTLPKGTPIPPSGPRRGPPPPPDSSRKINFGTSPKFTPIPPSGPSRRTSSPPSPPPPHPSRTLNFRMQHSGPSYGPPRHAIPPPPAF